MDFINVNNLSVYRKELLGLAMLAVIVFHVVGSKSGSFVLYACQCGDVGVDMFLFLSGMGLWFAWWKKSELLYFYRRRCWRIYPVWLLVLSVIYFPRYVNGEMSLVQILGEMIIGLGFWKNGDLSFWFISLILLLYLFTPFYIKLIHRWPIYRWTPLLIICICVFVEYWLPLHQKVGYLSIAFCRIPIFLLGINAGLLVQKQYRIVSSSIYMVLLLFLSSSLICISFKAGMLEKCPLFIERMIYVPLSITLLLLLIMGLRSLPSWAIRPFALVGNVSLEIYLIHSQFVLKYLFPLNMGFIPKTLLTILLSYLLALLIHSFINYATSAYSVFFKK